AGPREVEADERPDPEADFEERGEEGDRARPDPRPRQQPDGQRAPERQQDQRRRQPARVHQRTAMKTTVRTARLAAMARTYVRTRPVWSDRAQPPRSRTPTAIPVIEPATSGPSTRA